MYVQGEKDGTQPLPVYIALTLVLGGFLLISQVSGWQAPSCRCGCNSWFVFLLNGALFYADIVYVISFGLQKQLRVIWLLVLNLLPIVSCEDERSMLCFGVAQ
jgi:hypothetical protein